jgi:hypothetical protein
MQNLFRSTLFVLTLGFTSGCASVGVRTENREAESLMVYLDRHDVSTEERAAALESFLEEQADDAVIPDAVRWREYLVNRLQSTSIGLDEGLRTGDLLRRVATTEALRELETYYAANRRQLSEGNKIAIVMAGQEGPAFGESVLSDRREFIQVREAAFERMAALGFLAKAQEVSLSMGDPTLNATATRVGALYAKDLETLQNLAAAAKRSTGHDAHGRDAQDVAHIAISESNVSGKSQVLLAIWESGLEQISTRGTSEEERGHTAIVGIAMAHAIWSEADKSFVGAFLQNHLRPLLQASLSKASAAKSVDVAQIVAEFASAFRKECESRPVAACDDVGDPRVALSKQLHGILEPHIANTELAFYLRVLQ